MNKCKYDLAWITGGCKSESVTNGGYCLKHLEEKCYKCGKQATGECDDDHGGSFICGLPQCKEHNHSN